MAGWAFCFSLHWFCVQHKHTQPDMHTHKHTRSKHGWRTFKRTFRWNMHVPAFTHTHIGAQVFSEGEQTKPERWEKVFTYLNFDAGESAWLPSLCGLLSCRWCQLAIWLHFHIEPALSTWGWACKRRVSYVCLSIRGRWCWTWYPLYVKS